MSTISLPIIGGEFPVTRYRLQLAAAIAKSPWQQRPRMEQHDILMTVAQERAQHLANVADADTITPAHATPEDPRSANRWIFDAGYTAAGYDLDKNFVESWCGGYRTVDEAIVAWLNSTAHYAHLTGQGAFFLGQDKFGVGVILQGRYSPSWIFLSSH